MQTNEDTKTKNSKRKSPEKDAQRNVGRPRFVPQIPNKKFTFAEFEAANPTVKKLTLRQYIKRDRDENGSKSVLVLTDERRAPNSENKIGRKTFVWNKRSRIQALKKGGKITRKSPMVSVSMSAPVPAPNVIVIPAPNAVPASTEAVSATV